MLDSDILILKERDVRSLLAGRETELIQTVRAAYEAHALGDTSLPQSSFLRFPDEPRNRIIALPAYVGGQYQTAGIKWIASFPGNLNLGLDRASAVVILNSMQTGWPKAILEGSVISARRTAASAALAAQCLHAHALVSRIGVIGCGVINFEIVRFLRAIWAQAESLFVFDLDARRAREFGERCQKAFGDMEVQIAADINTVLSNCSFTSFATTALKPHVSDLSDCREGSTVLHISLRDLSPQVILSCDNVVDDVDHVCRAETSIHLAEQLVGHRNFIRCALPDILTGAAPARKSDRDVSVFSPFGLGILDLAVSKLVYDLAVAGGKGTVIESFCSPPTPKEGEPEP